MIALEDAIGELTHLLQETEKIEAEVGQVHAAQQQARARLEQLEQAEREAKRAAELAENDIRVTQEILRAAKDPSAVMTASTVDMRDAQLKQHLSNVRLGVVSDGSAYREAYAAYVQAQKEVMQSEVVSQEAEAKVDAVDIQVNLRIARLNAMTGLVQVLKSLKWNELYGPDQGTYTSVAK